MYDKENRFNFRPLGREIKRKREAKGWTQDYLGQLIDRTSHTIMYMEKRGQHPSLNMFYQVVTLLDISVDQFFFPERHNKGSERRQRIDTLLDSLDERELAVIEATAEGLKNSRTLSLTNSSTGARLKDGLCCCRVSGASLYTLDAGR